MQPAAGVSDKLLLSLSRERLLELHAITAFYLSFPDLQCANLEIDVVRETSPTQEQSAKVARLHRRLYKHFRKCEATLSELQAEMQDDRLGHRRE